MTQSIRTLTDTLIDYAGLFPPAKLDMGQAVDNYATYTPPSPHPHHHMLARFICPVSRLDQFRQAAQRHLPTDETATPWHISALIDGDLDENLDAIFAFNHHHASPTNGLALIDVIETKAPTVAAIDDALDLIPEEVFPFFEIDVLNDADPRGFVTALAGNDAAAKIRTGHVNPELIPTPAQVAGFLVACADGRVPFKATAGLHHPIRAKYPTTYEQDAPVATMHGFLNVFLTAALIHHNIIDPAQAADLLSITDPTAFTFTDAEITVADHTLSTAQLARTRESFALSFGSCSFTEPIEDLTTLKLL